MRLLRDLWWNATHARCPVCRRPLHVGRDWYEHKATHDPEVWEAALRVARP